MRVSVIIPYHNTDKKLFMMCMQSIFAQTYRNFEIILINDGSDESYLSILDHMKDMDNRVRIIHQKCQGASAARNRGIAESKGDYIAFVDADDMVMATYLEEALKILEKYQAELVVGGVRFVYHLEEMLPIFLNKPKGFSERDVQVLEKDKINTFKHNLASSRKLISYDEGNINRGPVARLIKREIAIKCPFREELVMWEDLVWNLELLDYCHKICIITKTWYLYYQHSASMIHHYRPNVIEEVEHTMKFVAKLLNLETDEGYNTFGDHIYDNLRRVYRLYFSMKECPLSKGERKAEYRRIYTSLPWSIFGEDRYYRMATSKNKISSFLYRKKLFFFVFGVKESIKQLVECVR